jgi:hypothetical protein
MTVLQMTFEQVLTAALALRPEQKAVLVKTLQVSPSPSADPTRTQLIADLEPLRAAGVFEHVTGLRNQFPAPSLKYVTDQQLLAGIRETANEWEADLGELSDHDD